MSKIEDIKIIEANRESLDFAQLRQMMGWSWGDLGLWAADLWQAFNKCHWEGKLDPTPIWFPSASPYGRWIGLCTGNKSGQTQHIQILKGKEQQEHANILLHEMVHQYLFESGQNPSHNAMPWCSEIIRLSRDIWGVDIWASPAQPRKVDGVSRRVQKLSPDGVESISRKQIACWPDSIGLNVPINILG